MNDGIHHRFRIGMDGEGWNNLFDVNDGLPTDFVDTAIFSTGTSIQLQSAAFAGPSTLNVLVGIGNFHIQLEFDAAAQLAGASFEAAIEQAATLLTKAIDIRNSITVNILVGANENGITQHSGSANGGPDAGALEPYATVRSDLIAAGASGDSNFNALPAGTSIQGQSQVYVYNAQLKSLGLLAGNATNRDGSTYFDSSISSALLTGVALHELTHAMGRVPYGPPVDTSSPDIFDLFRFTSPGTILIDNGATASSSAYFSVNGGTTAIAGYGIYSDPSDFLNSTAIGSDVASPLTPNDAFNQYYDSATDQTLTATDLTQIDVLGFNTIPLCFAEGTRIATPDGKRSVEDFRPGDAVRTCDGKDRAVRWIGYRHLDLARHSRPEEACPILIRADALSDGVPVRDLRVSPEHAMYFAAGLVPARLLLNGHSIVQDMACRKVTYYHIELDTHDIVLAENAPAETYLDTGNRGVFENTHEPRVLHPSFLGGQMDRVARSCAPFCDDPVVVKPIWRRLAERSAALGYGVIDIGETTDAPAVAIQMGGRTFKPIAMNNGWYIFALPSVSGRPRLVSRATAPASIQPWLTDRRRLGIAVYEIRLRTAETFEIFPPDHPGLTDGWWQGEHDGTTRWRWTDGDAALPFASSGPAILEVNARALDAYLSEDPRDTILLPLRQAAAG